MKSEILAIRIIQNNGARENYLKDTGEYIDCGAERRLKVLLTKIYVRNTGRIFRELNFHSKFRQNSFGGINYNLSL